MKKSHIEWKLLGSALLLAILFDLLFFKTQTVGINILLMQGAFTGALLALAHYTNKKISSKTIITGIFALAFAGTFAIWTSALGLTLSVIGLFASNLLFLIYLFGHHGHFTHPAHIASTTIVTGFETLLGRLFFFNHLTLPKKRIPLSGSIVKGILILLPIIFIFAILFVQSDLILQQKTTNIEGWFENIGDWIEDQKIIAHVFLIGFFTFTFSLILATAFWKPITFKDKLSIARTHKTESLIVLAGTNLLFLAFILFQAVYLFGSQSAWEKIEGITYSEYAVQGFHQLAAITALAILLVLSIRYFNSHVKKLSWLNALEIGLLIQTILIGISAWQRMSLYITQYSYTPARLAGLWFILLAITLLILLIAHIIKKTPQYKYINQSLVVIGIAMLAFTASAPDALSVRLNIARTNEKPIDIQALNKLSAEAFSPAISILTNERYTTFAPDPSEFCGELIPVYSPNGEFLRIKTTTPESPWKQEERNRWASDSFQRKWNNQFFKYTSEKGVRTPVDDIRTWNISRKMIPRNADGTIMHTLPKPFTDQEIQAACNFPTTRTDN